MREYEIKLQKNHIKGKMVRRVDCVEILVVKSREIKIRTQ